MLILNTGGTFNKKYNPINGELEVPYDNSAIEKILESVSISHDIAGVVYKDSLDMNLEDRKMLVNIILHSDEKHFLIVHGTDTIDQTAEFLSTIIEDKTIVLTGAMKPFEIDSIEASLNLGISLGFLRASEKQGVYISMNGYVEPWDRLKKNKEKGIFELV